MTSCAVVICVYTEDRWDEILESVESVRAQDPPPHELIVVVDHNPALQARLIERLPDVRVVPNSHERGLSGARNTGVDLTTGDVVVFLDDDAAAHPGWLAGLARHYQDPNVLGVGGRIDPRWATQRPAWWPPEFDWVIGCSYVGQKPGVVRNVIGANASFRRKLFAEGGFASDIGRTALISRPVGCEETEFCIRANTTYPDGVFLFDDTAAVSHHVPAARQSFSYFRTRCYSEGLSKAQVTRLVGAGAGLSSERTYTRVALPTGVARGIGDTFRGQAAGLLRAAAIVIGLGYTTFGYLVGTASGRLGALRGGTR
ncbi:hypothetical protein MANY_45210 [Mycolicibacterium anyangense]|uniref:Glycosyltransferase 2-like domain-containing protein n=1 Tax=Mycolicibacterium anyangense TaxID=1431246 RepID=A0A6N4WGF3_9MYCO|nr:glycosyltransferase family 2 protein [Mycolicibacterium anyangense]BBZ79184.1 hypothetical protein MANY_45210 [Mycolicibacterium anyangense]